MNPPTNASNKITRCLKEQHDHKNFRSKYSACNAWALAGGGGGVTAYTAIAELPLSGNDSVKLAFVAENNRLYIWNGAGWFNIALINTSPTITTGPNAGYVFETDGTPIVVTLAAADPEGVPITWSSQVTSGTLGNTAVITQNNNVFTFTPSTNEIDVGMFAVTFTASDGVNIATATASFTLKFLGTELYEPAATTLLLGLKFNDSSLTKSGSFTVTINQTLSYQTTGGIANSGYATGWNIGQGISINNYTTIASSLNKTYVAWYRGTQMNSGGSYSPSVPIFSHSGSDVWWGFGISNGKVCIANGILNRGTTNVATNEWFMLAWTVTSGGVCNGFVNGVKELTNIGATLSGPGPFRIGAGFNYADTAAPTAIDAVQIFNGILSDAQIAEIYTNSI